MKKISIGFLLCIVVSFSDLPAQVVVYEDFVPEKQAIYAKEWRIYPILHTSGIGFGAEFGKYNHKYKYSGWSVEFSTQRYPKSVRVQGYFSAYRYGLLNSFGMLRVGYGSMIELNEKPFWGGVNVSFRYAGGFSLGLALPQYLDMIVIDSVRDNPATGNKEVVLYHLETQRVVEDDPRFRDQSLIGGHSSFWTRLSHIRPYPGIYAKCGIDFEFGKTEEVIHELEAGIVVDFYFVKLPLMMDRSKPLGFFNFYLSYRFGKRYQRR